MVAVPSLIFFKNFRMFSSADTAFWKSSCIFCKSSGTMSYAILFLRLYSRQVSQVALSEISLYCLVYFYSSVSD